MVNLDDSVPVVRPTVGDFGYTASSAAARREGEPMARSGLSPERLRELARAGAEAALKQLRAEIIAIERTFPELAFPRRRRALRQSIKQARNRTRRMSAEARKAVSERMRRYWAERRKAEAKVKR
jgi:hypothetical protein